MHIFFFQIADPISTSYYFLCSFRVHGGKKKGFGIKLHMEFEKSIVKVAAASMQAKPVAWKLINVWKPVRSMNH